MFIGPLDRVPVARFLWLAGRFPDVKKVRALAAGLLVGAQCGVGTLGRRLSLPHFQLVPHHQHHLHVLVVRHVTELTRLVTGGTN